MNDTCTYVCVCVCVCMCVFMSLCVQVLVSTAEKLKNFAVPYLVDISEVPDFNSMYGMECIERSPLLSVCVCVSPSTSFVSLGEGNRGELTRHSLCAYACVALCVCIGMSCTIHVRSCSFSGIRYVSAGIAIANPGLSQHCVYECMHHPLLNA